MLQLTPDSVFKYGSVTCYWGGTVSPCYYMDRLHNKKINNEKKNIALNLKMNQPPRWSKRELAMVAVTRVAWASGLLNSGKQFHVLIESTMENWIRLRVLSCRTKMTSARDSWLPATEFWLICFNVSFLLMWVYRLWQNEWLFWYQCLYKWR